MSFYQNSTILSLKLDIKIKIFKLVDSPLNLMLCCKEWSKVAKDPHAKIEWLINKFGKIYSLFHAIRLGPTFINQTICKCLISESNIVLSSYLMQNILIYYGKDDVKLNEFKNQLKEGNARFTTEDYLMNLFNSLIAPEDLNNNLKQIVDLILKFKFIPFSHKFKSQESFNIDHQDDNDDYENEIQIKKIVKAIINQPILVKLWEKIGYEEICSDYNEFVFHEGFYLIFPRHIPENWISPTSEQIQLQLMRLIDAGFELNKCIMINLFQRFEHSILGIRGEILWDAFTKIRSDLSKYSLISELFDEACKPERFYKTINVFNFLKSRSLQHEDIMNQVVNLRFRNEIIDNSTRKKTLILSPKAYHFILKTYEKRSELTMKCFKDILGLKVYCNDSIIPLKYECSVNNLFRLYNDAISYRPEYIILLKHAKSAEVLQPFFEEFMPCTSENVRPIWLNLLNSFDGEDDCEYFNEYLYRWKLNH